MALAPRLDLRQTQTLVMTPQLRQAIQILHFTNLEAAAFVETELERNPLLERDERPETPPEEGPAADPFTPPAPPATGFEDAPAPPDAAFRAESGEIAAPDAAPLDLPDHAETYDPGSGADRIGGGGQGEDLPGLEDTLAAARPTLRDHLGEQLRLSFADPADRMVAAALVALLEPSGRLALRAEAMAETLGVPAARIEAVRQRLMRFDPTGMFAHDLAECLGAQLAERNRLDPAMATLLAHLDLVAKRDVAGLSALCGVDADDVHDMIAELRRLDPKPGAAWDIEPPAVVVPDVLMQPTPDGGWSVALNPETLPRVLVNHRFAARILPPARGAERTWLMEQFQSANWLVRSLQQRAQTILKVATEIVRWQDGFFRHGVSHLRPLILRDIAAAVEMHESTVSRVTSNKYIATPRGIFEMKYFFTTAIPSLGGEAHSAEAVRFRIRALITGERSAEVLSDDAIVTRLRAEGVDIARRTVAKYRESLRIPNSAQRRREKAIPA